MGGGSQEEPPQEAIVEGEDPQEAREAEGEVVTLSPLGTRELADLREELPRLEVRLREAEVAYAAEKPRFDLQRVEYPDAREEEIGMIRAVGRLQEQIAEIRQRIEWLDRGR